jgi:hypothetical protein
MLNIKARAGAKLQIVLKHRQSCGFVTLGQTDSALQLRCTPVELVTLKWAHVHSYKLSAVTALGWAQHIKEIKYYIL